MTGPASTTAAPLPVDLGGLGRETALLRPTSPRSTRKGTRVTTTNREGHP